VTRSLALPDGVGAVRLSAAAERVRPAVPVVFAALASAAVAADHGGYGPTSWGWTTLAVASTAAVACVVADHRPSRLELTWLCGLLALCSWTAASLAWTRSETQSALEVERSLVYASLAVATVVLVRRTDVVSLLRGVWGGTTAVCFYALATRLFPHRLGVTDPVAGYRLSTPVGYWNGLGLIAATAALLALGLILEGTRLGPRIAAGMSLPLLLPTLYLTFSRGAWIALAVGLAVALAISPARLTIVTALVAFAVPCALAVLLTYNERSLRLFDVPLTQAVGARHSLAWRLALVSVLGGVITALWAVFARRVSVSRTLRVVYAAALVVVLIAAISTALVHYGGPSSAYSRVRNSLEGGSPLAGNDLSRRLLTLSSPARIDQWHVALDEWRGHRLVGTGAGTYAQFWMAARSDHPKVLDVHNLYLETLAELGLVGLLILAGTLAAPLAAAVSARRLPLVAVAAGGYTAWLAHAAYDWDWELPAATIPAILSAGAVLAASHREAPPSAPVRYSLLTAAALVGVAGTLGLIGNRALAHSAAAARHHDFAAALSDARRARRFAPWSSQPWTQVAGIRLQQGRRAEAVAAYRSAVAKDPNDWTLWLSLAGASRGRERAEAVARLRVLSPSVAAAFSGAGQG
jgi:O-Antigen ligase